MSDPILDRPLTPEEVDACFWCRKTYDQMLADGEVPAMPEKIAKAGFELYACPRHASMFGGSLGTVILAVIRVIQPQIHASNPGTPKS